MWRPESVVKHPVPETRWPDAKEAEASLLFSPIHLGPVTLRTRTWVPAMVPWRATDSGDVTDALLEWYARLAQGRPGALVVEATGIRDIPSGPLLRIGDDRFVPGLRRLVEVVREAAGGETRLFIQLIDFLRVRRRPPAQKYFERFLVITDRHREQVGLTEDGAVRAALQADPSLLSPRELAALQFGARERVTDVDLAHIRDLPTQLPPLFAEAAGRARAAGFDGVELHYAHAYTMASFLSAQNDRADGYGGDAAGRLRLPLEVFAAVRAQVGDDYAVGCRFLADEVVAGGSRVGDAAHNAVAFAAAGMDFLSLSKGGKFEDARQPKVGDAVYPYTGRSGYECMPTVYSDEVGPFSRNVPLAATVRRAVRDAGHTTPVVAAGGLNDFDRCEAILQSGQADLVAAARQSLADPDWWLKMRLGRGDEVRRCKFTNYCEALDTRHKQVTCQLWDRTELHPETRRSPDGRRRLTAPAWRP